MPTATRENLRETYFLDSKPRVDEENGVIAGVKLLGVESKNGRRYPVEVMHRRVGLYEGAKSYINHPRRRDLEQGEDRSFRDWAGTVENCRVENNGIYGDLRLRTKSRDFPEIVEAADKFWKDFGMSHVADCEGTIEEGVYVVEDIGQVFSIDIVTDPATVESLYESTGQPMPKRESKTTSKRVREIIAESSTDKTLRLLLQEMEGEVVTADTPVEMPAEASADDQMKAAIRAAVMAAVDDDSLDTKATLKKIGEIVKMHEKIVNGGGESTGDDTGETEPTPPTEESTKVAQMEAKLAEMEAKTLLLESDREATDIRIRALASASASDRKALLESWPKQEQRRARGGLRPESSPGRFNGDGDADGDRRYAESYDQRVAEARKKRAG